MKRLLFKVHMAALLATAAARADINGFGNLDPSLWRINQNDAGSSPSYSAGTDTLQLTGKADLEARSIWYLTPQPISQFTASFIYKATGEVPGFPYGACFVFQNDSRGSAALGGSQAGLGYSGIANSVAISLEIGSSPSVSGLYKNGLLSGGAASTVPVNLYSGNPINVTMSYQNQLLQVALTDTVTSQSYSTSYPALDIPAIVGSQTALIGITGSSWNSFYSANQYFGSPTFVGVPEPASLGLFLVAAAALRRR